MPSSAFMLKSRMPPSAGEPLIEAPAVVAEMAIAAPDEDAMIDLALRQNNGPVTLAAKTFAESQLFTWNVVAPRVGLTFDLDAIRRPHRSGRPASRPRPRRTRA